MAKVRFVEPLPAMAMVKTARRVRCEKRIPLLARFRGSGFVYYNPHPFVPPKYEMNVRLRGKHLLRPIPDRQ
jgi:hypothetical protein